MFKVQLYTYKGLYRELEADSINLPTPDGRRGVLSNHMPIMLPVSLGIVDMVVEGKPCSYTVADGVFYFDNNEAILISDNIEDVRDINIEEVRAAESRARQRLAEATRESDIARAQIAIQKALNKINAYNRDK